MAKQYQHRTHVSIRKKKEEEKKLAKRRAFYKKYQKQLTIGAAALVVAILAISLAVDYFYAPGGSMRMFMGNLLGVEETSIIKDLSTSSSPRYYELGHMQPPAGYELGEYGLTTNASETKDQKFYFVRTDETKLIDNIYVSGVPNKTGAEMMDVLVANEMYAVQTECRTTEIAGHPVNYVYVQSQPDSTNESIYYSALVIYVDTIQNSSVLINCASAHGTVDTLPTEEALLAEAEVIMAGLEIAK